jgi:hypothetical protein
VSTGRVVAITLVAAVAAGLVVAGLLLFATSRGGDAPAGPFALGSADGLRRNVREEGPVYFADPTGGEGLWLDRRDGELVALVAVPPGGDRDCTVRWRDSIGSYVDCDDRRYSADELAVYPVEVRDGLLYVDTRRPSPRRE